MSPLIRFFQIKIILFRDKLTDLAQIAPYFAKVECFCFEEQKLLAGEEVDLPLFFFIDKDYAEDRSMANLDDIVLSYTFFRSVNSPHSCVQYIYLAAPQSAKKQKWTVRA
jgi:cytochrome c oxidase assembly protein Cox11